MFERCESQREKVCLFFRCLVVRGNQAEGGWGIVVHYASLAVIESWAMQQS